MTGFPREVGAEFEAFAEERETPGEHRRSNRNHFKKDVAKA